MSKPRNIRHRFYIALFQSLRIVWPLLIALMLVMAALGVIVSFIEGWAPGEGIYFAFVTGLTVGYGDLVPHLFASRILAIFIGFIGILLTAIFAAIGVRAMQESIVEVTSSAHQRNSIEHYHASRTHTSE